MTKSYFIQLAEYNIWANKIVHSWLENITEEQWEQPIVSSFNSIYETALHVAGAEKIWLDRLNNLINPVPLVKVFKGTKKELLEEWTKASQDLRTFIENFDEARMNADLKFKRLNGDEYVQPYYQLFAHVFNHSSYHRGQLVTMLRQAGYTDINSTDMINFFR